MPTGATAKDSDSMTVNLSPVEHMWCDLRGLHIDRSGDDLEGAGVQSGAAQLGEAGEPVLAVGFPHRVVEVFARVVDRDREDGVVLRIDEEEDLPGAVVAMACGTISC
ncbi:hypothetical protein [Nocardia sp. CY41]|uniref:hypothetical protein n=1 Tax=Nocardia sp. CY41 TaxID=2608686 RepID=UPI00135A587F|nr:hypothetical protein [Nocardia sp. CY41]